MKKQLANFITSFRLIGALVLIPFDAVSAEFLIIYTLCGLSDALDGFVARTLKITSELGKKLDSLSDLLLYGIMLIKVWGRLTEVLPHSAVMAILGLVASRIILMILYGISRHRFLSTHSFFNKATSTMMFLLPYALLHEYGRYYCYAIMTVGAIAIIYEIYYILFVDKDNKPVQMINVSSHINGEEQ